MNELKNYTCVSIFTTSSNTNVINDKLSIVAKNRIIQNYEYD